MKRKRTYPHEIRLPFTGMQLLGLVLTVIGLILLFGCGTQAYREVTSDPQELLADYQEELDAGVPREDIEDKIRLELRKKAAARAPFIVLGGILVLTCPPMFYAPYAEGIRIRRRQKQEETQADALVDEEYDYPDDEFDYILDPGVRSRLIRERDERREREKNQRRW